VNSEIIVALQAVSATCAASAGLFFYGFWQDTRDRLFLLFGWAFWLLALSWGLLALGDPADEARPYIYAIRLLAFALIIAATIDKNRHVPSPPSR
jgi:hypothetical protein